MSVGSVKSKLKDATPNHGLLLQISNQQGLLQEMTRCTQHARLNHKATLVGWLMVRVLDPLSTK
jgi:hypothetical protein